jgi:hypothetical protein
MKFGIFTASLASWLLISSAAADPTRQVECLGDCAAFDEGYNWAEANGIASEFECDGHGPVAFIGGCAAYIVDDLPEQWVFVDPDLNLEDE